MPPEADGKKLKIVIITGLSGSGKSTALAAFEDAGFYCVDNMPVALLPKFLELPVERDTELSGFAFVMDLRERAFLARYPAVFDALRKKGYLFEVLFLEAEEQVLVRRYSQTRRHHPLSGGKGLLEGIRTEREHLKSLRNVAAQIIDTSRYTVHELKALIVEMARERDKKVPMRINILSFGFKYGIPHDADLIMDVRFLANPHFVPELRPLDGRTSEIREYVLNRDESRTFLGKYLDLISYLIPLYEQEGKAYLTIAIGCTGGRHRSVAVASAVAGHIHRPERWVDITHRDIEKV
ncbi:RNase adaptor protein RapZ [Desulfonema ishimotonii]|uniref:RNase adaptor protein RapZ n=2 Tax=Desulfonema ishimotonii TaxID=45657 RepID=A0A401G055_9BACT|nr:RNase adaptor protein RapZ [Desulfonema ishimotonii]